MNIIRDSPVTSLTLGSVDIVAIEVLSLKHIVHKRQFQRESVSSLASCTGDTIATAYLRTHPLSWWFRFRMCDLINGALSIDVSYWAVSVTLKYGLPSGPGIRHQVFCIVSVYYKMDCESPKPRICHLYELLFYLPWMYGLSTLQSINGITFIFSRSTS